MLVLQDNMKNGFVRARAPVPLFKEESFRLFMSLRGFETAVEVNLQKFSLNRESADFLCATQVSYYY